MGDCKSNSLWSYEGDGSPIRLMNSAKCLKAVGERLPPSLSEDCLSPQSSWKTVSMTGLHLATFDKDGDLLCLEKDSNSSKIVTSKCICISDDDSSCLDNPQSQWFKLVSTNVQLEIRESLFLGGRYQVVCQQHQFAFSFQKYLRNIVVYGINLIYSQKFDINKFRFK